MITYIGIEVISLSRLNIIMLIIDSLEIDDKMKTSSRHCLVDIHN